MKKIVLASYFEEENHGSGRKIGISPGKPNNLSFDCDSQFEPFSPEQLYWDYHNEKKVNPELAAEVFISGYREKLNTLFEELKAVSGDEGKPVHEILPFQDGDTLLSWEKRGSTSYRAILAEYLRDVGYDVEEN